MPQIVPAIVTNEIRADGNLVGVDLTCAIIDELTVKNPAFWKAKNSKRYGWWEIEKEFILADLKHDTLIMPRGYAKRFKQLLREDNKQVEWIERRTWQRGPQLPWRQKFIPRDHQPIAVKRLRSAQQGIYEAPTGSGKSLTGILFLHELSPLKSIVLVDKTDLLAQWIKEIGNWIGSEYVGQIGSGAWIDEKRITVATCQSIWSKLKRGEIDDDWFSQFDCLIVDECHHVSAASIQNIASRYSARIRLGFSATPDRKTGLFEIITATLGPVVHSDSEDALRTAGVLVKPQVQVIKTDFDFNYWNDGEYNEDNCPVPKCRKRGDHRHHNNYQALKDAIVYDEERNRLVVDEIERQIKTGPHHHLIVSDEIRHLEALLAEFESRDIAGQVDTTAVLTGQISKSGRRDQIAELHDVRSAAIFATVAKEGLDIPRVDRIYISWPTSNPTKQQQWLGRATRIADGKTDAIVFDFHDILIQVLKKQFRNRRYKCYDKLGLEVVK